MTYQESLDFLYARLPMFHRIGAAALKYDLSNTIKLLDALGNPQNEFKCIHIAGTNGKGTSAHSLSAILSTAGHRTGLFTSPHLKSFTERSRIDGLPMSEEFVAAFVSENQSIIEQISPSFFEVTFAMAMLHFRENKIDVAVVETGLGGRLDSTNIINPIVCLITSIGWDHADLLGDSLEKIATEKAGIIKANTPVVIGANQPDLLEVFQSKAKSVNASLFEARDYFISEISINTDFALVDVNFEGESLLEDLMLDVTAVYYQKNIPGILKVIDVLNDLGFEISKEHIRAGLKAVKSMSGLKGRWQTLGLKPQIIADISHNLPGLIELFKQMDRWTGNQIHIIFGVVKDKAIDQILDLLKKQPAQFYFTQSSVPRSLSSVDLKQLALETGVTGESYENVNDAIEDAKKQAQPDDLILICGSTFVVAEIEDL
jgi:dihydrofolate synthase/folylpolyglutamate synthase